MSADSTPVVINSKGAFLLNSATKAGDTPVVQSLTKKGTGNEIRGVKSPKQALLHTLLT